MARTPGITANLNAFLDTIAVSEIGRGLLAISDDGYNVIVGSTVTNPHLFVGYEDHPRQLIDLGNGLRSTAAGRYQILARYWDYYKGVLGLVDFSPASQDAVAIQFIRECHALPIIEAGRAADAFVACASRWASLPGAQYGQHVNNLDNLLAAYKQAGGNPGASA